MAKWKFFTIVDIPYAYVKIKKKLKNEFTLIHHQLKIEQEVIMQIVRSHKIEKANAVKKIDSFLNALMRREFPGGVKIKDAEKHWNGDNMTFSFKAKKGLVGTTISGSILVTDSNVKLTSNLPGLVTTFVSEEKIKNVISQQFDELFTA